MRDMATQPDEQRRRALMLLLCGVLQVVVYCAALIGVAGHFFVRNPWVACRVSRAGQAPWPRREFKNVE
jgi:hypothetical protein